MNMRGTWGWNAGRCGTRLTQGIGRRSQGVPQEGCPHKDAHQGGPGNRGALPYPFDAGSRPRAGNPCALARFTWNARGQNDETPPPSRAAGPSSGSHPQALPATPCRRGGSSAAGLGRHEAKHAAHGRPTEDGRAAWMRFIRQHAGGRDGHPGPVRGLRLPSLPHPPGRRPAAIRGIAARHARAGDLQAPEPPGRGGIGIRPRRRRREGRGQGERHRHQGKHPDRDGVARLHGQQNGLPHFCRGPAGQLGAPSTAPVVGLMYWPGTSVDHGAT